MERRRREEKADEERRVQERIITILINFMYLHPLCRRCWRR